MTDQLEPTRRSARVPIPMLGMPNHPTAKHAGPSGQDTPLSPALSAPAGFGAACSPQALTRPNQRSTRGELELRPDPSRGIDQPTTVHVRLRGHETSVSCDSVVESSTSGMFWTIQRVPSQRIASSRPNGEARRPPTAVQARGPEQETAPSTPFPTSSLGWIDHLVPSQSSMSGLANGEFGSVP